jgi:hypothetical protein
MIHKNIFLLPDILSRLIFTQSDDGKYYVQATQQQKPRRALPEEIIRQLFVLSLIHHYGYPENRLRLEFGVQMGRTTKRADIVVLDRYGAPYIVVEVKQEIDQFAKDQLSSYVTITRASFGIAVSADIFHCIANNGATQTDLPLFGGSSDIFENNTTFPKTTIETPCFPFQIDDFERINQTHVNVTIKGYKSKLSNIDLASYKKLQRHFLSEGVVINSEIKQQDWFVSVTKLLDITPIAANKYEDTPSNATDNIDIVVIELLQNSHDPLCGNDVTCFYPLMAKVQATLPLISKANSVYLLSRSLSKLGFLKLSRIRIQGEQHSVWVKRTDGIDPTVNWAKEIIESRLIACK